LIQMFGDIAARAPLAAKRVDPLEQFPVVGKLLVTCDWSDQLVATGESTGPVKRHFDLFAVALDVHDHAFHKQPDDLLTVLGGCGRPIPPLRNVLG